MRHGVAARYACAFAFTFTYAFALTALARDARAAEPALALDYEAPPACPTEATFATDVHERIAERPGVAADGKRFRVRIVEEHGAYHGSLESLDPPSVREVAGETCAEVVRALVVFVALAMSPVDPGPTSEPRLEPAPRASPAGPPPPPVEAPPAKAESPGRRAPARPRLGLDVRVITASGITPGLAPGGAIAARLALETRPSFRWVAHAGGVAAYREKAVLDGSFDFAWYAARIDAGPALDLGPLRVSAGAAVRAGVLSASADNLPAAGRYTSFWGDVGGFFRVDHALTSTVALSLMVELGVPLQRRTFGIERVEQPVHEIAPVIGVVSFGVALGR